MTWDLAVNHDLGRVENYDSDLVQSYDSDRIQNYDSDQVQKYDSIGTIFTISFLRLVITSARWLIFRKGVHIISRSIGIVEIFHDP